MSTSIISYNKNRSKINELRRRFFIFSSFALIVIVCISLIAFFLHRDVISQLKTMNQVNKILLKQSSLIEQIKVYGKFLDEKIPEDDMIKSRSSLELKAAALKSTSKKLSSLVLRSESASLEDLSEYLENKKIRSQIKNYISYVNTLADPESSIDDIQQSIRYISKNSSDGDTEYIDELLGIIELESIDSMKRLERMGLAIVLLCLLEVFIVWFFLFRPLNSTILEQNKELLESALKVESAARSKTDFLANVSHEIRTPMTAILGYAELLQKEGEVSKEEAVEVISVINKNASHLLGLLDEVLDVSKMESGKFDLVKEKVDLKNFLEGTFQLLSLKAEEKGIELLFESDGVIPEYIEVDPKRLKQVLFNVIGNAIKFTSKGYVKVSTGLLRSDKLQFTIQDTGCGIPKEKIQKVFEPFEQATVSADRQYSGTGLGLVLSRGLARKMGGDVQIIKTVLEEGSTFTVTINPGDISLHTVKGELKVSSEIFEEKSIKEINLKSKKFLVVDDAKENARLFKMYLESAEGEVTLAYDGFSALDLIKKNNFDLVLLDLQMPGMDGYQVMEKLKEIGYSKPICALTAHAMSEEVEKTKKLGFHGHFTKPISSEKLLFEVNLVLS